MKYPVADKSDLFASLPAAAAQRKKKDKADDTSWEAVMRKAPCITHAHTHARTRIASRRRHARTWRNAMCRGSPPARETDNFLSFFFSLSLVRFSPDTRFLGRASVDVATSDALQRCVMHYTDRLCDDRRCSGFELLQHVVRLCLIFFLVFSIVKFANFLRWFLGRLFLASLSLTRELTETA